LIFRFWRNGGNAPTPTAPSARKAQAGKNSFPPTPFLFARLLQRPQGGRGGGFFK